MSTPTNWLQKSTATGKTQMQKYISERPLVKQTPFKAKAASAVLEKYEKKHSGSAEGPKGASQGSIDQFMALVAELITTDPFMREGHQWAARPQTWWASRLSVSTKQVQRISRAAPVRFLTVLNDTKMTVYRPGSMADKTPEDYARIMSAMWRKATDRQTTPHDFGMLVGLSKDWPAGLAPNLFNLVVKEWQGFCAGVKNEIALGKGGYPDNGDPPEAFADRYWKYPSISVIRRFHAVAVEMAHDAENAHYFPKPKAQ